MATKDSERLKAALDLRVFLREVKAAGELQEISGAHWNLELGALTELFAEQTPTPALLFDGIPDYPKGRRVLSNVLSRRCANRSRWPSRPIARHSPRPAVKGKLAELKPIPPEEVKTRRCCKTSCRVIRRRAKISRATLARKRRRALHRHLRRGDQPRSRQRLRQRRHLPRAGSRREDRRSVDHSRQARQLDRAKVLEQRRRLPVSDRLRRAAVDDARQRGGHSLGHERVRFSRRPARRADSGRQRQSDGFAHACECGARARRFRAAAGESLTA